MCQVFAGKSKIFQFQAIRKVYENFISLCSTFGKKNPPNFSFSNMKNFPRFEIYSCTHTHTLQQSLMPSAPSPSILVEPPGSRHINSFEQLLTSLASMERILPPRRQACMCVCVWQWMCMSISADHQRGGGDFWLAASCTCSQSINHSCKYLYILTFTCVCVCVCRRKGATSSVIVNSLT